MAENANLPSTVFVLVVIMTAALILWVDTLLIKLALSILLGLLLVGSLEAVHQATHGNFLSGRRANLWFGTSLGLVLLLNFARYRAFHAHHHAHTATRNDPERDLYLKTDGHSVRAFLLAPLAFLSFVHTVQNSRYAATRLRAMAVRNSFLLALFISFVVVMTIVAPLQMFYVYWGPLALFAWFDFLLNQAEHYGMSELPPGSDPAQATNNLRLPKPLAILFLYRNLHRVHHLAPKTLWYQTEKAYIKQGDPGLPFRPFLRRYLAEGPRLWGVR